jgi:hypothetical protein
MPVQEQSPTRLASLGLVAIALVASAGFAAGGEEPKPDPGVANDTDGSSAVIEQADPEPTAEGGQRSTSASTTADGYRIEFRDPATGKPRSPSPEELRALLETARARGEAGRAMGPSHETVLEDGTVLVHQGGYPYLLFSTVGPEAEISLSHSPEQMIESVESSAAESSDRAEEGTENDN